MSNMYDKKRGSRQRASTKLPQTTKMRNSMMSQGSRDSRKSNRASEERLVPMSQMAPYHQLKDITMKDTWSIGPLSKFTFEERTALKHALKHEYNRYFDIASERHPE
mmetsp:Transcript_6540/g.7836  ORF Transcript_6540/g.7836 Transcript_6540/m.7836 type:complete len:107 (+) Transcript_6540:180-500(+)